MKRSARQLDQAVDRDIEVADIDGKHHVVLADGGTEQHRASSIEIEDQPREKAGVAVIEALLAQTDGLDIPITVENGEGLAVLEDAGAVVRQRGFSEDVILILDFDDIHRFLQGKSYATEERAGSASRMRS